MPAVRARMSRYWLPSRCASAARILGLSGTSGARCGAKRSRSWTVGLSGASRPSANASMKARSRSRAAPSVRNRSIACRNEATRNPVRLSTRKSRAAARRAVSPSRISSRLNSDSPVTARLSRPEQRIPKQGPGHPECHHCAERRPRYAEHRQRRRTREQRREGRLVVGPDHNRRHGRDREHRPPARWSGLSVSLTSRKDKQRGDLRSGPTASLFARFLPQRRDGCPALRGQVTMRLEKTRCGGAITQQAYGKRSHAGRLTSAAKISWTYSAWSCLFLCGRGHRCAPLCACVFDL